MKRVLIVEDQPLLRSMVRDILEYWPEQLYIEEEENGLDAIVNLECRDYDLIICDVMMPEMDGFEVVRTVRGGTWNPEVPIILLTAECDELSIVRGLTLGATSYLTKPFNESELVHAAAAFLGGHPGVADAA